MKYLLNLFASLDVSTIFIICIFIQFYQTIFFNLFDSLSLIYNNLAVHQKIKHSNWVKRVELLILFLNKFLQHK